MARRDTLMREMLSFFISLNIRKIFLQLFVSSKVEICSLNQVTAFEDNVISLQARPNCAHNDVKGAELKPLQGHSATKRSN